jgi:hypothetical protein
MRMWVVAAVLAAGAGAAAAAEPQVSMTIYNSNLALVEEVRTLDIPAGRQRLEFKDVSAAIRPETVTLSAPGVTIVEQNFDYDLLTPDKLMEKAVGQQVRIVRTNPGTGQQTTETATVLAVNEGVVLKIGDRIEVLRDDGVPTRVIFDKVPENLRAHPTLSVTVDSARAGPRAGRLSYLTTGLSWKADYVALFDEKAGKLDLQGWITLSNSSGTGFKDADVRLVAGDVNLTNSNGGYRPTPPIRRSATVSGGSGGQSERAFGDYYIYPINERTTVAQNQTKQVGFVEAKGVAARKIYKYQAGSFGSTDSPVHVPVVVEFANAGDQGLGSELPAGIVRVYVRDVAGDPKFIGEDSIAHTPQGSQLNLETGEAFDVTVQSTILSSERIGKDRTRYEMKYVVRNARSGPVTVQLEQYGLWYNSKVLEESQASRRIDAGTLAWDVEVPASGETELTFKVETRW